MRDVQGRYGLHFHGQAPDTERAEAPRMDNSARDIEMDLVILGARGKSLVIMKATEGYSAVVLDRLEHLPLVGQPDHSIESREHFNGPTISEACRLARAAVQDGRA